MSESHQPDSVAAHQGTQSPQEPPHDAAHFHDHSWLYMGIGGLLLAGTGLTVALSYVDFGGESKNIIAAMLLATAKASAVALVFMHLKEEKMTIYQFMLVTMIFVTALFGLTWLAFSDHIVL